MDSVNTCRENIVSGDRLVLENIQVGGHYFESSSEVISRYEVFFIIV
jgi:hypothetical protein